jgi:hypothetical protein
MPTHVLVLAMLCLLTASAAARPQEAQTSASFTGTWEGTVIFKGPDGEDGNPNPSRFSLTQEGTELTGTAGPTDRELPIEKGVVADGKATFQLQIPKGPLFTFTVTIVEGRLKGEVAGELNGAPGPRGSVDAAPVK